MKKSLFLAGASLAVMLTTNAWAYDDQYENEMVGADGEQVLFSGVTFENQGKKFLRIGKTPATAPENVDINKALSGTIENSVFRDNFENAAAWGGVVHLKHFTTGTIRNSTFSGNTALTGGAIAADADRFSNRSHLNVLNSAFENNIAYDCGGAISIWGEATIENSTFTGNKVDVVDGAAFNNSMGGGAIYAAANAAVTISQSSFTNNTSEFNGGAISTRGYVANTVDTETSFNAEINISDTTFTGNEGYRGGAIFTSYGEGSRSGKTITGNTTITNGTFTNNTAEANGGAIYNTRYISDAIPDSFIGTGGGHLILAGNNVFSGNKVGTGSSMVLNDIHNNGTIDVSGSLTLDGGISGDGTTTFANGSKLTAQIDTTTISGTVVNSGATLSLISPNNYTGGTYQLIINSLDNEFELAENMLYTITPTATHGTYEIVKKESAPVVDEIKNNGGTANDANALLGWEGSSAPAGTPAALIQEQLNVLAQSNVGGAVELLKQLTPNTPTATAGAATSGVTNTMGVIGANAFGGSAPSGKASGDPKLKDAVWAQGLYNKAEFKKTDNKWDAETWGFAAGADHKFDDGFKLGAGYSYTDADIKAEGTKTPAKTHTVFVYGEYNPAKTWYVNGIMSYSFGKYKPESGIVKGEYDVDTFGAQFMGGYTFDWITPEGGIRYFRVQQDSYTDSIGQHIGDTKSNIWTAVLGAKASKAFKVDDMTLTPTVRLAATYDLKQGEDTTTVGVFGASYDVKGKNLDRFGFEAGAGLTADWGMFELTAKYEGKFRSDYTDNTGMLEAKYNF